MRLLMAMVEEEENYYAQQVIYDALQSVPDKKDKRKLREILGLKHIDVVKNQNELFLQLSKSPPDVLIMSRYVMGEQEPEEVVQTILQLAPKVQIVVVVGPNTEEARRYITEIWRMGVKTAVSWESVEIDPQQFQDLVIEGLERALVSAHAIKNISQNDTAKDNTQTIMETPTADVVEKETPVLLTAEEPTKEGRIKSVINRLTSEKPNGIPTAIIGFGNSVIEEWFFKTFVTPETINVVHVGKTAEDIRDAITTLYPDILVIARYGQSIGGIPDADAVAIEAVDKVSAIVFIAGELDDEGLEIYENVKAAGINRILSCPAESGSFISVEELVLIIESIISELRDTDHEKPVKGKVEKVPPKQKDSALSAFKTTATKLGQIIKQTEEKTGKKSLKKQSPIRKKLIPKNEGVSLEESNEPLTYSNTTDPTMIRKGSMLCIVSPWRPGLAGRLAAQAVRMLSETEREVAYIGGSGHSTGAIWLDIADNELMMADWRTTEECIPIKKDNITIYAVDPAKNIAPKMDKELWEIVNTARKKADYTVLDLGGDIEKVFKAAHLGWTVVLAILPGGDPCELKISQMWLRELQEGKENIVIGMDTRNTLPSVSNNNGIKPKVIVNNNVGDAIKMVLKRNDNDEFYWN